MERIKGGDEPPPPSSPLSNPSPFFRDISNFKTPKQNPRFFTASKQTPTSSTSAFGHRPSSRSKAKAKTTRRLKAFELEQSQSSRKTQIRKEKSLKSLAKSLSVWLNFLFQNPTSCGCRSLEGSGSVLPNGKRDSWPASVVGIDGPWRTPKRQRASTWPPEGVVDALPLVLASSSFSSLKVSLKDICSFDDLTQRMRGYLSSDTCKQVFSMMTQVTKNIDDGRLKMKAHCPIVTDLGMKKKALQVLMCYNPMWLRIGLYIIFGGDSLLPTADVSSDQEVAFLKTVAEKFLFSHMELAKAYAYNKLVEGLYRPGYFEALGNVILKRFLLLVIILDKVKSESSLPIKYGIDGIDGGSPLLFLRQSHIKSSRQIIQDFLSTEVMHGEGNLFAHLVIVGYKVSYQQIPLLEYDFNVANLFDDLQDGVRLCRAIQLLQCDNSIVTKMVVPSDTNKKNLVNCSVAMQYLKQAGMSLLDEDGTIVVAEDVASGERELTLSVLWNMFVHLQIPLLINKMLLSEEIGKIKGVDTNYSRCNSLSHLQILLEWIEVISQKYDIKIDSFASLVDGKALWCLIDYYFCNNLQSCCKAQDVSGKDQKLWDVNCSDAVHNFILSQKLTTVLGNFPEVFQISDILENNGACNERSVIVLLVFLSSQLITRKNTDQLNIHRLLGCNCQSPEMRRFSSHKCFLNSESVVNHNGLEEDSSRDSMKSFKVIQAWWRDMAARHHDGCENMQTAVHGCKASTHSTQTQKEKAATTIQSYVRRWRAKCRYVHMVSQLKKIELICKEEETRMIQVKAAVVIQLAWRKFSVYNSISRNHIAAAKIQSHWRGWLTKRKFLNHKKAAIQIQSTLRCLKSFNYFQQYKVTTRSAVIIQTHVRGYISRRKAARQRHLIILIQGHWRGWQARRDFLCQRQAAIHIQSAFRCLRYCMAFQSYRHSAIEIQRFARGQVARRRLLGASGYHSTFHGGFMGQNYRTCIMPFEMKVVFNSVLKLQRWWRQVLLLKSKTRPAIMMQSYVRGWIARKDVRRRKQRIIVIQSHWRGWQARRDFLCQRQAAIQIQSGFRCLRCCMVFQSYRRAAIEIQRFARGQIARRRLLSASGYYSTFHGGFMGPNSRTCIMPFEMKVVVFNSVLKLQRWWRQVLLLKSKTRPAVLIQSHVRGWIARKEVSRRKQRIIVIQSYWKGCLARKRSRGQLLDIRLRVRRSAANVDDGMRLINRLVSALSELLSIKSVSSVLHTCATLDVATKHSEKCCETLVAAGAIDTLLKLIQSVSRSIPDQVVLKHALSTLRNLARYPHLADVLIDTNGSAETVFWELLRNKEEGFFIASELLKKLCSKKNRVHAIRDLPAFLKRLQCLVDDLKKKVNAERRKVRPLPIKEDMEKRLREAMELLKLITIHLVLI